MMLYIINKIKIPAIDRTVLNYAVLKMVLRGSLPLYIDSRRHRGRDLERNIFRDKVIKNLILQ